MTSSDRGLHADTLAWLLCSSARRLNSSSARNQFGAGTHHVALNRSITSAGNGCDLRLGGNSESMLHQTLVSCVSAVTAPSLRNWCVTSKLDRRNSRIVEATSTMSVSFKGLTKWPRASIKGMVALYFASSSDLFRPSAASNSSAVLQSENSKYRLLKTIPEGSQ